MKKITIIAALAALTCGCSKFMEDKSYTQLDGKVFFDSKENTEFAVNSCYKKLTEGNVPDNYVIMNETSADNICIVPGKTHKTQFNWLSGIYTYTDSWPQKTWEGLYALIYDCNYVLENINPAVVNDSLLTNRYMAEARFMRGWAYLILTNAFGDIPLRTTTLYKNMYDCPLTKQDDIYNFLLADLQYAEDNLFDFSYDKKTANSKGLYSDTERFRVSVTSALGMEALAYLYRAGNDPGSPYWKMARDKAKQCIDRCGGLADQGVLSEWLNPSYGALWADKGVTGKWHRESLFAVYHDRTTDLGTGMGSNWCIFKHYAKATYAGYCRHLNSWYTKHFTQLWDMATNSYIAMSHYDARNAEMLHHVFYNDADPPANLSWPALDANFLTEVGYPRPAGYGAWTAKGAGPFPRKYDDDAAPNNGACDVTLFLLRYAEVLLIFAEAENEVNGRPTDDAYKALDMVRTRAKVKVTKPITKVEIIKVLVPVDTIKSTLPPYADSLIVTISRDSIKTTVTQADSMLFSPRGMTREQFRNYVFDERDREFFLEGKRLFDLNRRGLYATKVTETNAQPEFTAAQSGNGRDVNRIRGASLTKLIFAIPKSEVDANKTLMGSSAP